MAAGLALVERALVGEVGSPVALLRTLRGLGDSWTDPVTPVPSLMALLAEALVGYHLLALALRWLCLLPGLVGRAANRTMALVTPTVVRRALDLLVGGTLLAQAALTVSPGTPPGHPPGVPQPAIATSPISGGAGGPATLSDSGLVGVRPAHHRAVVKDLVVVSDSVVASDPGVRDPAVMLDATETRPVPRRSAAPLPPWLGGGPSTAPRESTDELSNGSTDKSSLGRIGGSERAKTSFRSLGGVCHDPAQQRLETWSAGSRWSAGSHGTAHLPAADAAPPAAEVPHVPRSQQGPHPHLR
jgi:hypothetical protein